MFRSRDNCAIWYLNESNLEERKAKAVPEEMSEIEKLQEELDFLRMENAYLKKLREYRLREEIEEREKP